MAAVLAASLLALVWETKPAEAAFPGANGKLVFSSDRTTGTGVDNPTGDQELFVMNQDGTGSSSSPSTRRTIPNPPFPTTVA